MQVQYTMKQESLDKKTKVSTSEDKRLKVLIYQHCMSRRKRKLYAITVRIKQRKLKYDQ